MKIKAKYQKLIKEAEKTGDVETYNKMAIAIMELERHKEALLD